MKKILSIVLTICLVFAVMPLGVFNFTASAGGYCVDFTYNGVEYGHYLGEEDTVFVGMVDTDLEGELVIPAMVNGKQVIGVAMYAFWECTKIQKVVLPEGMTYIDFEAFTGCENLSEIVLPDSIESIGLFAFTSTAYYNDDKNWENGALYLGNHLIATSEEIKGKYTVKDGTISVAFGAFRWNSELTEVVFPDSLKYTTCNTFESCAALTLVKLGNGLKQIASGDFNDCSSLESITIPSDVTSIGDYAFMGCSSLTSVTIPSSVERIGSQAFLQCINLETVSMTDSVTSIGSYAFDEGVITYCHVGTVTDILTEKGYTHKCFGDFDNDKNLSITDAVEMRKALMGDLEYDETVANYNQDENFDARDLVRLKKELAGITM